MKIKLAILAAALATAAAAPLMAEKPQSRADAGDEFYIISSVNLQKNQLVLKRPTEVTVLMEVNDKTVCLDEKGKPLHLKELRAGDTVFVASRRNPDGNSVATRIRKGYMTLEEVHSRYLNQ
jgi:ABC-type oligopeptide transport system substrate-binding subunit